MNPPLPELYGAYPPSVVARLREAMAHQRSGLCARAKNLYQTILRRDPACGDALRGLALIARQEGQTGKAVDLLRAAGNALPGAASLPVETGELLTALERYEEANACFRRALEIQADHPHALSSLARLQARQGNLAASTETYRQAVAAHPASALAHTELGNHLRALSQHEEALRCYQRLLMLTPDDAAAHNDVAGYLEQLGRPDDALALYRRAVALQPDFAVGYYNLARLLAQGRQDGEALEACRRALALQPRFAEAHNVAGVILNRRGALSDAARHFEQALAFAPDSPDVLNNLAAIRIDQGRGDDALPLLYRALQFRPDFPEAYNHLADLHKQRGEMELAVRYYREALRLDPSSAGIHSNLVLALHYCERDQSSRIAAEVNAWNLQHGRPRIPLSAAGVDRHPDRRLRIGYVSPDFRDHAVGQNLLPLFLHHEREHFEIFCYADLSREDPVTDQLRNHADHWRDITRLADDGFVQVVRHDHIDILVDLALHTASNRLPAFAARPAPIQVSFAGYPGGTGLTAMDYHLTDPFLEPAPAQNGPVADVPFLLPQTFWCYHPLVPDLVVSALPASRNGHVTFGCFNNPCKTSDAVLALWARVLGTVARSTFRLLVSPGSHHARIFEFFSSAGIAPERIALVTPRDRRAYLQLYEEIDIGLDTFPYNGHTTSLDSCWMGVPVVSLIGSTPVGRAGWSQLSNLGLAELAASSPDEFVAIAARLAGDLSTLGALRSSLRTRMERSPLMDQPAFARAIENAYRVMWRRWCDQVVTV